MRNPRVLEVIRAVEARYPGHRVAVKPYRCLDDPTIRWWIYFLDVPVEEALPLREFGLRRAIEIYDNGPLPFLLDTADAKETAKLLAGKYGPPPRLVTASRGGRGRAARGRGRALRAVRPERGGRRVGAAPKRAERG